MIQTIGIVGTGNVGGNLGARLAEAGYSVRYGMREGSDASELLARSGPNARAVSIREAADCDAVFLAVPSAAVADAVSALGGAAGKIVVDCTNPVGPGISHAPPPEGSNAALIAKLLPHARVVKGWNVFGAEFHADPRLAGDRVDVPLASDDADAKRELTALADRAGFRALDAGGLANAKLVEAMAILWIHFAMKGGLGREIAWKLQSR
jgi:predicted dinucleotide-binding enzyme